jgi:adenylate cyclase
MQRSGRSAPTHVRLPGVAIDWEAEGLLDGLDGEAREARIELLEDLIEQGASLDEIKNAAAEGRLVLLPVEKALEGEGERYTAEELAERAGLDLEFLERLWAALGAARPDPEEKAFSEEDLEGARAVKRVVEGGMPERSVLEISRVMGQTLSRLADAIGRSFAEAFLREGDNERELARRYAEAVHALEPQLEPMIRAAFRLHQRENVRRAAVGVEELQAGLLGSQEVAVCFADLVDFTRLGERIPPDELGEVAGRLEELASEVAAAPVRLVKTIGDAAMLVSRQTDPLLQAALDLVEAAEDEGEEFPLLRAGLSRGPALQRAGDWYGSPVNLASRITDFARPGSVVADKAVRDAAEGDYAWSFAGKRHLKGVKGEIPLYRVRRAEEDGD